MNLRENKAILESFRRFTSLRRALQIAKSHKPSSRFLPLGFRYFRGEISRFDEERNQMAELLELHEAGESIDRCYFHALRSRMKNLRSGKEITRDRVHRMIVAEKKLREEEEVRALPQQLVKWADAGMSTLQILNQGLKRKIWAIGEITPGEIQAIIETERLLQTQEKKEQDHV